MSIRRSLEIIAEECGKTDPALHALLASIANSLERIEKTLSPPPAPPAPPNWDDIGNESYMEKIETGQMTIDEALENIDPHHHELLQGPRELWDAIVHLKHAPKWQCQVEANDDFEAEDAAEEAYLKDHPDKEGIFDINAIVVWPHEMSHDH